MCLLVRYCHIDAVVPMRTMVTANPLSVWLSDGRTPHPGMKTSVLLHGLLYWALLGIRLGISQTQVWCHLQCLPTVSSEGLASRIPPPSSAETFWLLLWWRVQLVEPLALGRMWLYLTVVLQITKMHFGELNHSGSCYHIKITFPTFLWCLCHLPFSLLPFALFLLLLSPSFLPSLPFPGYNHGLWAHDHTDYLASYVGLAVWGASGSLQALHHVLKHLPVDGRFHQSA